MRESARMKVFRVADNHKFACIKEPQSRTDEDVGCQVFRKIATRIAHVHCCTERQCVCFTCVHNRVAKMAARNSNGLWE